MRPHPRQKVIFTLPLRRTGTHFLPNTIPQYTLPPRPKMGKNKRLKRVTANNKPPPTKKNYTKSPNASNASKSSKPTGITKSQAKPGPKKHVQAQHTAPTIPFEAHEKILLIGEGDLSFARSLLEQHRCTDMIATVYESKSELVEKYPHCVENIEFLEEGDKEDGDQENKTAEQDTKSGGKEKKAEKKAEGRIRYNVDATKTGPVWKEVRGKCQRIIFNFPHVGGKSKDVNRQVRYNQELLVSFFKIAQTALAPQTADSTSPSSIVVTLFEGEPYTLWNIRDLARHAGLQVQRSFKFQASIYGGYRHARTLGVVHGKDGNGEGDHGWKGEERAARSYVFVRKGDEGVTIGEMARRRWGDRGGNDNKSSDDEDIDGNWGDEINSEYMGEGEEIEEGGRAVEEGWNGIGGSDTTLYTLEMAVCGKTGNDDGCSGDEDL